MGLGTPTKTIRDYIAEPSDAVQQAIDASLSDFSVSEIQSANGATRQAINVFARSKAATKAAAAMLNLESVSFIEIERWSETSAPAIATYVKVSSEPAHDAKFQSADGFWFSMLELKPNIKQFGAMCDNVTDDAPATQRAIDYAQTFAFGGVTAVPPVILPNGSIRWASTVIWKTSAIICEGIGNTGVRIYWDGPVDGIVLQKWGTSHPGNNSFGRLENINFRAGSAVPATFIDFTQNSNVVDKYMLLRNVSFRACSGDAIKCGSWVNVHWEHLRFDDIDGFCVLLTPLSTTNLSNFVIDKFTYDNVGAVLGGLGVIHLDNTAGASNVGLIELFGGRIEINKPLVGNKTIFQVTELAGASRSANFVLDGVQLATRTGFSGNYIAFRNSADTSGRIRLTLIDIDFTTPSHWTTVGGTFGTNQGAVASGNIGFASVGGAQNGFDYLEMLTGDTSTDDRLYLRRRSEANNRWAVTGDGYMRWGSGSAVYDVELRRSAADTLRLATGDKFIPQTTGQELGASTAQWRVYHEVIATASLPAASAAMNGVMLIEDAGTGDRNLIIYAGGQRFRIDGGANV